jgi:hypothetical protein
MSDTGYLGQAVVGLADMDKGLSVAMAGAVVASKDGNLPSDVVSPLREAARAVEFAKKKVALASASIATARKIIEATSAD